MRFERYRTDETNCWIDQIQKDDLCQILDSRQDLITIFDFASRRHHGNFEEAILESLFNGSNLFSCLSFESKLFFFLSATKFPNDQIDEQQCRIAELKLSMVR